MRIISLILFLLFTSQGLFSQTEVNISVENNFKEEKPYPVKVFLVDIKNNNKLWNCTNNFSEEYKEQIQIKNNGNYSLHFEVKIDENNTEKLEYPFSINGKETDIKISIIYREKYEFKDYYLASASIEIIKYYSPPEGIEISLDRIVSGNRDFAGPVYLVKNYTKDSLYGIIRPGYFWGNININQNDSIIETNYGGIDLGFKKGAPLAPDSSRIAIVGSFGATNKLPAQTYRYELLLWNKYQSFGIAFYKQTDLFLWWASTKEFYRLTHDFEVKSQMFLNPNIIYSLVLAIFLFFISAFISGKVKSRNFKTILNIIYFILAIPALSMILNYLHLFDDSILYIKLRSIPDVEISNSLIGLIFGGLAKVKMRKIALFIIMLLLVSVPYIKPIIRPLALDDAEKWQDDVCLQSSYATCGPSSLATIFNYFDIDKSEYEIAKESFSCNSGTEIWYLLRYAKDNNMDYNISRINSYSEIDYPSIIGTKLGNIGHFITVLDKIGNNLIIADPLNGKRELNEEEFFKKYELEGLMVKFRKN